MKIVHISTSDIRGGAARSAYRLHSSLKKKEIDSSMLVGGKLSSDPSVIQYQPESGIISRLARMFRKERIQRAFNRYSRTRPDGYEHFHDDRTEFGGEPIRQIPAADLLNLHSISTFLDFRSFFGDGGPSIPVVWTLHDMHAFTGGCHFDDSSGCHLRRCGNCPQLGSNSPKDLSRQIWLRKKAVLDSVSPDQLVFVSPSRWLAGEARRSLLLRNFSTVLIPYGIDTNLFRPNENAQNLRKVFKIPETARIILFLAEYTGNRRKGFQFLDEALLRFKPSDDVFLLSIGNGKPEPKAELPHLHLGPIADERLIAAIYSLADIFMIPSLQDNLPNTVLEAMACGTPIVGFDAGGIRDMVANGENGFLAPVGNSTALAEALREALPEKIRYRFSIRSREIIMERFREEIQADRYIELYRYLTGKRKPAEITANDDWFEKLPEPVSGEIGAMPESR